MTTRTIGYDSAIVYLRITAEYFIRRYPNRFEVDELINGVWVDPCFHRRVIQDTKKIQVITFSCMSHFIDKEIRPRRKYITYNNLQDYLENL